MQSIQPTEYNHRRRQLMEQMAPNSLAIIVGATETLRNNDVQHPFRQSSDFTYLTGFTEPDAVAVLIPQRPQGEFLLFVRDKDAEREIWDGYRAGPAGAVNQYGADDAFPIGDLDDILPGLIEGRHRIYSQMGQDDAFDKRLMLWIKQIRRQVRTGAKPPEDFSDINHLLHQMRLIKSDQEIAIMAEAAAISARAHQRAMRSCCPNMMEYQLQAEIEHECLNSGSMRPAYSAIVASGHNACVLHYIENSSPIQSGDLVLIDAGCEWQNYASDITRTFPANGHFTPEQAAVYQWVLNAQKAAIDAVKPGNHWNAPHEAALHTLVEGLIDLGILTGSLPELIESRAYLPFFMHRTGHWLGMDVHDVGAYKVADEWRLLEPGMVLTIEPGLYIAANNQSVDKKWRGIGIRIEDDVVVTPDGSLILSEGVPKEIDEIEALMKQPSQNET